MLGRGVHVVRRVGLPRPAAQVWARVTTVAGIDDELRPLLRMTVPSGLRDATLADVGVGEPLGRSWLLLGRLLPVEYDDLRLVEVGECHFVEASSMATLSSWRHRREVVGDGPGACVVVDTLDAVPRAPLRRVPGVRLLVAGIVGGLFSHRHRRLLRWAAGADHRRSGDEAC